MVAAAVHPTSPVSRILLDHKTGSGKTLWILRILENYYIFERGVSERRESGRRREGWESRVTVKTQDDSEWVCPEAPQRGYKDFRKTARDFCEHTIRAHGAASDAVSFGFLITIFKTIFFFTVTFTALQCLQLFTFHFSLLISPLSFFPSPSPFLFPLPFLFPSSTSNRILRARADPDS